MKTKTLNTTVGSFYFGYTAKSFGLGFRIDTYGINADFLCFWFGYER